MSPIELRITPKLLQQQRLILTQDLQLFLKLIHMTTIELSEYLEQELIENPALEEEAQDTDDNNNDLLESVINLTPKDKNLLRTNEQEVPYLKDSNSEGDDELSWENTLHCSESLLDYLRWQLKLSDLSTDEQQVASLIIGNTNEDGYLEVDMKEIAIDLIKTKPKTNDNIQNKTISEEQRIDLYNELIENDQGYIDLIESVLKKIQTSFDPPGVCARNLNEALKIQLEDIGYQADSIEIRVVNSFLENVSKKEFKKIAENLGVSEELVKKAVSVILTLEPKPGRPFYKKDSEKYIVPDFFVYKVGDGLQIQLNREFPKVRVSHYYKNLINKGKLTEETKKYIKEKLQSAQRIIKCLEERDTAMRKIITKIVDYQKDFFEYGTDYIKPLRLKDIAHDKDVDVHESTVSRITSRRYIYTPQGIIELKSLFSRKIETSHGPDISFEKVKSILKEIIATEIPESPYSDEDISKILERRNIKVARRTISKYRKVLNIPSSSQRTVTKDSN